MDYGIFSISSYLDSWLPDDEICGCCPRGLVVSPSPSIRFPSSFCLLRKSATLMPLACKYLITRIWIYRYTTIYREMWRHYTICLIPNFHPKSSCHLYVRCRINVWVFEKEDDSCYIWSVTVLFHEWHRQTSSMMARWHIMTDRHYSICKVAHVESFKT